jgi:hypothetical protein
VSEAAGPNSSRGDGEVGPLPVLAGRSSDPLATTAPTEGRALDFGTATASPVIAATGGCVAGLAAFLLARVLRRHAPRPLGRPRRKGRVMQVAGTRSFLVDVHLLKR